MLKLNDSIWDHKKSPQNSEGFEVISYFVVGLHFIYRLNRFADLHIVHSSLEATHIDNP